MARESVFGLFIFAFVVLICNVCSLPTGKNNDTFFKDSQTAEMYLTPLKLVRKHGYPGEAHIVKSQDGYILELHRIPHGKAGPGDKKRIPILIHHGLLSSSIDWVVNGPGKSLGYRLADEGYDVWLANARGNKFSRSHVRYSPQQKEFWNYSFHEMGFYDLPAIIDHILETTGETQLIYMGHSLGTTVFFVMTSTLPEYNKKIKFQISLAPVTTITHATSSYRLLVPQAKTFINMLDWYNRGAFLETDPMTKTIMSFFYGEPIVIFSLFGRDPEQFNATLYPVLSTNFPSGTSGKNLIHSAQLISSGTFSQYDYGKTENIKKYGSDLPPKYNVNKINVPIRFYYGENDILSTPLDTKLLYQKIAQPLGLRRIKYDKFNHVDYLWAKDINKLLNDELIEFINNATNPSSGFNFIQDTLVQALDIRNKTSVPVNAPFDRKSFSNKVGNEKRQLTPLSLLFPSDAGSNSERNFNKRNGQHSDVRKLKSTRSFS